MRAGSSTVCRDIREIIYHFKAVIPIRFFLFLVDTINDQLSNVACNKLGLERLRGIIGVAN
jgi:hypothetical protein